MRYQKELEVRLNDILKSIDLKSLNREDYKSSIVYTNDKVIIDFCVFGTTIIRFRDGKGERFDGESEGFISIVDNKGVFALLECNDFEFEIKDKNFLKFLKRNNEYLIKAKEKEDLRNSKVIIDTFSKDFGIKGSQSVKKEKVLQKLENIINSAVVLDKNNKNLTYDDLIISDEALVKIYNPYGNKIKFDVSLSNKECNNIFTISLYSNETKKYVFDLTLNNIYSLLFEVSEKTSKNYKKWIKKIEEIKEREREIKHHRKRVDTIKSIENFLSFTIIR